MKEAEWLASDNPSLMLKYLRRRWSRRKVRLFTSEVVWPYFEGFFNKDELAELPRELDMWVEDRVDWKLSTVALRTFTSLLAETTGLSIDWARLFWDSDWLDANRLANSADQITRHRGVSIIRDLANNPFRPVTFHSSWRTSDVMLLARGMYDDRAFDRMPILADALQDAGCNNNDILSHCRDSSLVHVRGCWVVDLVLGKE